MFAVAGGNKELLDGNEEEIINSFHNDIISGRMERK